MADTPANVLATNAIDPNVKLPPSVTNAAAAADALHKQAYQPTAPAGDAPQPDPAQVTAPVTPPPPPADAPPPPPQPRAPADAGEPGSWEHRYHSMKGRYDQSQSNIGQLQEQMAQMGDEMVRLQQAFVDQKVPRRAKPQQEDAPPAHIRLSQEDMQTYGPELINLIQRAALDAVAPELGKTVQAVKQTQQKVAHTATVGLYQSLDRSVPDWRAINADPAFRAWCGLPDVYSGMVRGTLLKNAFAAADAPRVVAFFQGYKAEQQATGQLPAPVHDQQQGSPAPRQAAVALDSLVAPGRAKPATGDTSPTGAAEKPIFTRTDIKNFYRNVQNGVYAGREQDKARDEGMIFAAQREGRVRG